MPTPPCPWAYHASEPTTVTVAGTIYTTREQSGGELWQPVTGQAENDSLVVNVDGGRMADIYPQAA